MEIFLEAKSTFYKALEEIINKAYEKRTISKKEIYEILTKYNCNFPVLEDRVFAKNTQYQKNIYVLKQQDDKSYGLRIDSKIEPYVTNTEVMWLKFMMSSRYAELFLDIETIEKIRKLKSSNIPSINTNLIVPKNYSKILKRENAKDISAKMKMVIKGIIENKILRYTYKTRQGDTLKDVTGIPVKIQYSLKDDMFYVIFYSLERGNFAKCIIQNLENLRYDEGSYNRDDVLKEYDNYLKNSKAKQPIVLEVINTRNALERAFCMFSSFEKSARFLKEKNRHEMRIYYYEFEEAEIISRILYLGRNVVVVNPQHIRDRIISRVKNALEMYSKSEIV
ncbi:WYL domain-containing protein [Anaerocellum danielii]|uniref:WYL domain-containing protein n=1 Tax=Anaerocellum danielii TaxID=1387557 RepID=A0ABZ0U2I3_9FIRM|nr:WYL domain-containing protein [Caldicellulosiruptor danielii]WPX08818.1 WYL domain-containing protein [Caldicellulosiruptor danielii]